MDFEARSQDERQCISMQVTVFSLCLPLAEGAIVYADTGLFLKGHSTIKGSTSTSPNTFAWEGLLLVSFEVHHGGRNSWV